MNIRILSAFLVLFVTSQISAQTAQTSENKVPAKEISVGVVNGKAVSLPAPAYPPTAKAVNAGGPVSVQVIIDEEGNVIFAAAVSGHPLLRQVSVSAARQARFKPTLLSGEPVKVSGIVVYNFLSKLSWRQIGYELGGAENQPFLPRDFPAGQIGAYFPEDWNEATTAIAKLSAKQRASYSGDDKGQLDLAGGATVDIASIDHKEILGFLRSSLENRLSSDPDGLWNLRLGLALGKIDARINDDDGVLRSNILELHQFSAGVAGDRAVTLNLLLEFGSRSVFTAEDKVKIKDLIGKLKIF